MTGLGTAGYIGRRRSLADGEQSWGVRWASIRRCCATSASERSRARISRALGERIEGKVRDSYVAGKRRFIVVTDRVSCFDRVVGTLPFKGQVLNQIAAFWFERTREIAPNHLLEVPDPNVSIVRECRPLPVEFVYRGYLTGSTSTSIWTAYARGERVYCGHRLPDGLAPPRAAARSRSSRRPPRRRRASTTS